MTWGSMAASRSMPSSGAVSKIKSLAHAGGHFIPDVFVGSDLVEGAVYLVVGAGVAPEHKGCFEGAARKAQRSFVQIGLEVFVSEL